MHKNTHVPPDALELLADVMLAAAEPDSERPTYDERRLAKRAKQANKAEIYYLAMSMNRPTPLGDSSDRPDPVGMSTDETTAWRMFREGRSFKQIADEMNVTRQKARRLVRNALRRGKNGRGPLDGLTGIYRAETLRRGYHPPFHCADEPCRKLGYCKCALKGGRAG